MDKSIEKMIMKLPSLYFVDSKTSNLLQSTVVRYKGKISNRRQAKRTKESDALAKSINFTVEKLKRSITTLKNPRNTHELNKKTLNHRLMKVFSMLTSSEKDLSAYENYFELKKQIRTLLRLTSEIKASKSSSVKSLD